MANLRPAQGIRLVFKGADKAREDATSDSKGGGRLIMLTIIQARGLRKPGLFGLFRPNPYCMLLGDGVRFVTSHPKGTTNPLWNERYKLCVFFLPLYAQFLQPQCLQVYRIRIEPLGLSASRLSRISW